MTFPTSKGTLNDHIPADFGTLEYASFDDAVTPILITGPGAVLFKKGLSQRFPSYTGGQGRSLAFRLRVARNIL